VRPLPLRSDRDAASINLESRNTMYEFVAGSTRVFKLT
jgi:hypothetical protein